MIVASSPWVSVGLSYAIVLGSIALLALRSRQRGDRLAARIPAEQRRWMTDGTDGANGAGGSEPVEGRS